MHGEPYVLLDMRRCPPPPPTPTVRIPRHVLDESCILKERHEMLLKSIRRAIMNITEPTPSLADVALIALSTILPGNSQVVTPTSLRCCVAVSPMALDASSDHLVFAHFVYRWTRLSAGLKAVPPAHFVTGPVWRLLNSEVSSGTRAQGLELDLGLPRPRQLMVASSPLAGLQGFSRPGSNRSNHVVLQCVTARLLVIHCNTLLRGFR